MKYLPLIICSIFFSQAITAQQTGTIKYTETIKLNIKMDDMPGVDIKSMLPESTSFTKALYFNETASMYMDVEGEVQEDTEITSDDGSFRMVFKTDDGGENIMYTDLANKTTVDQQNFMGKNFVISGAVPEYKWKITGEKIKYLDYECMKATTTHDEKSIIAWFTPQLPAIMGPAEFGQLPGAILMVSKDEGEIEIKATEVILGELSVEIKVPKDGKKVSQEEFEIIQEEKIKEMEESMKGKGKSSIMIRG